MCAELGVQFNSDRCFALSIAFLSKSQRIPNTSHKGPLLRPVLGLIRPESTIRSVERLGGPALTVGWNQGLQHIVNGSWAMLPMSSRFSLRERTTCPGEHWVSKRCLL